jgi:hypothetical protein
MTATKVIFQQPLFKNQVFLHLHETRIEVNYNGQGCSLSIPEEYLNETVHLLRLLQAGGKSLEKLQEMCPNIAEDIPGLLTEFEQRGLLVESPRQKVNYGVTGQQFYRDLSRFIERLKQQLPASNFGQKMIDKTITRNELIGYALESYHVTHLCPKLLAPALANYESVETQTLLQEFFASELHHDRLLEKSLKTVGITQEQLEQMQPLPMTFAVCSSLAVFAKQHPLSFKAALVLFEEDSKEFHDLFKERCQALDLPTDFYKPILLHAGINEEGGHQDITGLLLTKVPYVSPEEQALVKKNMAVLMESIFFRSQEILEYYGNSEGKIPRCFD